MDVKWKKREKTWDKKKILKVRRSEEKFIKNNIEIFRVPWLESERDVSLWVVIPCYYKHFYMLKNLIKIYHQQTVLPMEIVISISEISLMDKWEREKFERFLSWIEDPEKSWKFPIDVVYHPGVMLPGANKNCAISRAGGDVIVIQDADDIPHIQRLEVVKWWFDHADIVHLEHGLNKRDKTRMLLANEYTDLKFNRNRFDMIGRMNFYRRMEKWYVKMPKSMRVYVSNGEVAFLRSIVSEDQIEFDPYIDRAEDWRFNRFVEEKYGKTICLQAPLVIYNRVAQIRMGSKKIRDLKDGKNAFTNLLFLD